MKKSGASAGEVLEEPLLTMNPSLEPALERSFNVTFDVTFDVNFDVTVDVTFDVTFGVTLRAFRPAADSGPSDHVWLRITVG